MKRLIRLIILSVAFVLITITYCYKYFQFWTHLKTNNFNTLIEYNGENIKGFKGRQILVNKLFKKHIEALDKYAQQSNVKVIINQSYRSKKRNPTRSVVPPAEFSNHHAGFAIDFNLKVNGIKYFTNDLKRKNFSKLPNNIQNFIYKIRKNKNLRWGGDFNKEDPIHIDYPINTNNRKAWVENSRLCDIDYSKRIPKWKIWIK